MNECNGAEGKQNTDSELRGRKETKKALQIKVEECLKEIKPVYEEESNIRENM